MRAPIGRFAPSPTGVLHLGSLFCAVASFCQIKAQGGKWLLRLEDTDFTRCQPAFSRQIIADLTAFGLRADAITYQAHNRARYHWALTKLARHLYACRCSRKHLAGTDIYPRYCNNAVARRENAGFLPKWLATFGTDGRFCAEYKKRNTNHNANNYLNNNIFIDSDRTIACTIKPAISQAISRDFAADYPDCSPHPTPLAKTQTAFKIRLKLPDKPHTFTDGILGKLTQHPADLGDMVIARTDGVINYVLAAAVDDAFDGITDVVRGADILPMTAAQQFIQQQLGFIPPKFWHLPLIVNRDGQKLSKQTRARGLDLTQKENTLFAILRALGQPIPKTLRGAACEAQLAWAVANWTSDRINNQTIWVQDI